MIGWIIHTTMTSAKLLVVGLLIWAILASSAAAYYYTQYLVQSKIVEDYRNGLARCQEMLGRYEELVIHVNILIDFGNGTMVWFNDTLAPIGASLLNATMAIIDVEYVIGEYGAFITSIGGVENNQDKNLYWIYWVWDESKGEWVLGPVAADQYIVSDGETLAWSYSDTSTWPPSPPGG